MATTTSELFKRFDFASEVGKRFQRDLDRLLGLSVPTRDLCLDALLQLLTARNMALREQVEEDLLEGAPEPASDVLGAVDALTFIVSGMAGRAREDDPDAVLEDLLAANVVRPEQVEVARSVLTRAKQLAERYAPLSKREQYARGILPSLVSAGTTVELRAVQGQPYRLTQDVATYSPDIRGVVGIASVSLATDSDENSRFFFQADAAELGSLIAVLQATEKDLRALEAAVPGARKA